MENIITREICIKCAECCKNHPFVNLSGNEITSLENLTGLQANLFTNPKGKEIEEYFLQFKENGDCFFLVDEKGIYSCGVYEARPKICKNYPSEPRQKKVCDAHMGKFLSQNRERYSLATVNRLRKTTS